MKIRKKSFMDRILWAEEYVIDIAATSAHVVHAGAGVEESEWRHSTGNFANALLSPVETPFTAPPLWLRPYWFWQQQPSCSCCFVPQIIR